MSAALVAELASRRRRARVEAAMVATLAVVAFVLAASFDAFDRIHDWLVVHEDSQVDELLFAVLAAAAGLAFFSGRRWRDYRAAYERLVRSERQLFVSEKMAALGRLTAGIAHEMNTPIGAVRAALSRLQALADEYAGSIGDAAVGDDDHREIAREMAESIALAERAAVRAANYVHSIRTQTRARSTTAPQRFAAAAAIREALLLVQHQARSGKCELRFEDAPQDLALFGSPGQLGQVVTNLVTNAIEASAPAGSRVDVELERRGDRAILRVRDGGCGIAPEVLPHIFDPFFSTRAVNEGTGLGLSLVHEIATAGFGGTLDVHSEVGRGTTFTLDVPIARENRHGSQG